MKKITLDQNNFKHFFSPVGPLHSYHEEHVSPYDYVDRDSDTLLVTIGDSWTWGAGICNANTDAINITEQEDNFRRNHLYGNLISKDRSWNWLNLGFYSIGNQWIANKVFELRGLVPRLEFKKIIVMINFTGAGRWFNTWQDSLTDYKKFFTTNKMTEQQNYENFLIELNRKLLREIMLLCGSDERIQLLVGSNQVDHCGFDVLHTDQVIPLPWYKLLSNTDLDGIFVDLESIRGLQRMEHLLDNSDQRIAFQKWMIAKIEQAEKGNEIISKMQDVAEDKCHPNHNGNRKWAEYLLKDIL